MTDTVAQPAEAASPSDAKTVAIIAYITIIGFIVAIVIHMNKKTKLGAYHLRQMLGLVLCGIANGVLVVIPIIGWIAAPIIWIALFVLWIMGLIAAINGQMKPVPVLGEHFQKWFGTVFD